MTIQISISGHAEGEPNELAVIETIRDAVAGLPAEIYLAEARTQHHGIVDLRVSVIPPNDQVPAEPDTA